MTVADVVKRLVDITVHTINDSSHEDIENKSMTRLKRTIHSDDTQNTTSKKRNKFSDTFAQTCDNCSVNSRDNQSASDSQMDSKAAEEPNDGKTSCCKSLVLKNQNDGNVAKGSAKKTPKQVKWMPNIVNPYFSEDSLNVLLSETYYHFGTGIVTGEAGDMFGGNRFQGFSRHLLSDSNGITVELCKPFIINRIVIELENKCRNKSPMFAYKLLVATDECMTEWELIKHFDQTVCFGEQDIEFYPRFVQYIRIVGSHGLYHKCDTNCEPTLARYFTLLNFDCMFDQKLIQ